MNILVYTFVIRAHRAIQRDLDIFVEKFDLCGSHRGYRLKGRTPAQELREALGIEELPSFNFAQEKDGSRAEKQPAA
ncbi:MAG: hypothetical protein ACHQPI_00210 [Thermoanaerobaculia bacterium]